MAGEGSHVRILGTDRDSVSWNQIPALTVTGDGAVVEVERLSMGNIYYNNSSWASETGMAIYAPAADAELHLSDINLDDVSATIHNTSGVAVSGDLYLTDVLVEDWTQQIGTSYSNSCTYRVLTVAGDLHLTRTTFANIRQTCGSWSHSAWGATDNYVAKANGDVVAEDVLFSGVESYGSSSGTGSDVYGALLHAGGSLTARDLRFEDSRLYSTMTCARYGCYRLLVGGLVSTHGDLSWSGGGFSDSEAGLDGEVYHSSYSFTDSGSWASILWYGSQLELDEVDLGEGISPDVVDTQTLDAEGTTSVVCDSSGCD